MDFRPVEEGDDRSDSEGSHSEDTKELDKMHVREGAKPEQIVAGKKCFSGEVLCTLLPLPASIW